MSKESHIAFPHEDIKEMLGGKFSNRKGVLTSLTIAQRGVIVPYIDQMLGLIKTVYEGNWHNTNHLMEVEAIFPLNENPVDEEDVVKIDISNEPPQELTEHQSTLRRFVDEVTKILQRQERKDCNIGPDKTMRILRAAFSIFFPVIEVANSKKEYNAIRCKVKEYVPPAGKNLLEVRKTKAYDIDE